MRELTTLADDAAASGDDALMCWAAQRLGRSGAAFAHGDAVAVTVPALNRHDRFVFRGAVADAEVLIRQLLPALPDSYRALTGAELAHPVLDRVPELQLVAEFGWMETKSINATASETVSWLGPDALPEATALIERVYPGAYVHPGESPEHRWAGMRDETGRLVAVVSDACTGGGVGFISGLVTDPEFRGRGYGRAVTSFVANELLNTYGRVALMVDNNNDDALRLYRAMGFVGETVAATMWAPDPATGR
ncbi:GNAT family N-acetyltransferase [Phytoactinopolyspora mesophila]|uniref:GNAT family N-acetyltransferase n=1 Tax=Phytoactinopolyspora mesophila TaxID=2650750 RepID=A0A7K3M9P2_9ACTN|nr:GNAT family N-acetyltransferase [Phytoactinopolyspora mesophila]NDL60004.1 GNAT family N-acetyltransferase [Phytoactinopolyspora mesophila]